MEERSLVNSTVNHFNFTLMTDEYVQENLRLNEAIGTYLTSIFSSLESSGQLTKINTILTGFILGISIFGFCDIILRKYLVRLANTNRLRFLISNSLNMKRRFTTLRPLYFSLVNRYLCTSKGDLVKEPYLVGRGLLSQIYHGNEIGHVSHWEVIELINQYLKSHVNEREVVGEQLGDKVHYLRPYINHRTHLLDYLLFVTQIKLELNKYKKIKSKIDNLF